MSRQPSPRVRTVRLYRQALRLDPPLPEWLQQMLKVAITPMTGRQAAIVQNRATYLMTLPSTTGPARYLVASLHALCIAESSPDPEPLRIQAWKAAALGIKFATESDT